MVSVTSWAHRSLRGLPRYHHCPDEPEYCKQYSSLVQGSVIGVYVNPDGFYPEAIVITAHGLCIPGEAGVQHIQFRHLLTVRGPNEKEADGDLHLTLQGGGDITLRVEGGDGKYKDVYSMVRFLSRVIETKKKYNAPDIAE